MIKAEQLIKKYGSGETELTVLKNLHVHIKQGEFVAIVGPSGAGKSTLLYQLSLLDTPSGGEVYIDGVRTQNLPEAQKTKLRLMKLGYVFQDYALLPELTAIENVALPMLMQGVPKAEAVRKATSALTRLSILDKQNNLPSQLSGGQQQRVSIARAIAHDPKIVFADEPTANLDSASSRSVMDAFEELHAQGQTIVMVTHEEEYAKRAERILLLKDGIIVSDTKTR